MSPNYNRVAWFYDNLAKLVFGLSLEKAKTSNLHYIKAESKVLIIGGGTGTILNYLEDYDITLDFVEISKNMIGEAKNRVAPSMGMQFFNEDIFYFPKEGYDVIICNFFMDQLNSKKAADLVNLIYDKLNNKGILLISDFIYSRKIKHRILTRMMYLFFLLTSNLKKVILTDFKILFRKEQFLFVSSTLVKENIRADVYQKTQLSIGMED